MTTEQQTAPTSGGVGLLLRSGGAALTALLALALVAGLVTGRTGAAGVLTGGVVALLVFLGGSLVVDLVAGAMPSLSLLFALSTYTLQVLVLGLFFSALGRSDLMGPTLHAGWLGASIIAVTVVWLGVQVVLTSRARIPLYDLSRDLPSGAGER